MNIRTLITLLGNGLNNSVNYFDERIKTGKFIGDIRTVSKQASKKTSDTLSSDVKTISHASTTKRLITFFNNTSAVITRIPILGEQTKAFFTALKLLVVFYADFFIVFALTFPMLVMLINTLHTNITLFFILFFPVLYWITYCVSALFICIQKKTQGEHEKTLLVCFKDIAKQIFPLFLSVSLHIALLIELTLGLIIVAFFYTYIFSSIGISWSGNFFYWFFVVFLGLLFSLFIYILTIVSQQAYFLILIERQKLQTAIRTSWKFFNNYQRQFLSCYFLLFTLFALIIYNAAIHYFYTGFSISIYFMALSSILLGYILHKDYYRKELYISNTLDQSLTTLQSIIIFFGITNYIFIALLGIKHIENITTYLQQQRNNYFYTQQLKTYANKEYQYTIEYPQQWTVYERSTDAVTIYNNYTGTISGGTWITIDVTPYTDAAFLPYYDAATGAIKGMQSDDTLTYKISNISIQGHPGASYTQDKLSAEAPEFQTNYLIHRKDLLYKISFISKSKNIEGYNYETIEKSINSFRFIEK